MKCKFEKQGSQKMGEWGDAQGKSAGSKCSKTEDFKTEALLHSPPKDGYHMKITHSAPDKKSKHFPGSLGSIPSKSIYF